MAWTQTAKPTPLTTLTPFAIATSTPLPSPTQQPYPTFDTSTPAFPGSDWASYTYAATGLSFKYPANWFIELDEENNRIRILNAPPLSVIAIKASEGGDARFVKISVSLNLTDISSYKTLEAYIDATLQETISPERLISAEPLPTLPQGYKAVRVRYTGLGEYVAFYVANDSHVVRLITDYLPDRKMELAQVIERVVDTLVIP